MTLNRYRLFFVALGCGLVFAPAARSQSPADGQPAGTQAQPSNGQNQGGDEEPDPLKRKRSDKEKWKAQKARPTAS